MKQTNKKYISKEMAMMAALTTESMLLHENYDAMLYWHSDMHQYCILLNYIDNNPVEKYPAYSCSSWKERTYEYSGTKEIALYFKY